MITHSVFFKLSHEIGSAAEKTFLNKAASLSSISGVQQFRVLKQTGSKNNFDYGLSMQFSSQQDYDAYNNHPEHVDFVENVWLKEVVDFMEIDFEEMSL